MEVLTTAPNQNLSLGRVNFKANFSNMSALPARNHYAGTQS